MGRVQQLDSDFWENGYTGDKLDPAQKLLYVYFITGPNANICGIYQVAMKTIEVHTGYDRSAILTMSKKFEQDFKIMYRDGWVAVAERREHNKQDNPNIQAGALKIYETAPLFVKQFIKDAKTHREQQNALTASERLGDGHMTVTQPLPNPNTIQSNNYNYNNTMAEILLIFREVYYETTKIKGINEGRGHFITINQEDEKLLKEKFETLTDTGELGRSWTYFCQHYAGENKIPLNIKTFLAHYDNLTKTTA
jgi:hypothetical protein